VAEAPLPSRALAFDIGTGTGVLAAVLARRGVARIVATDQDPRALACARDNLTRLGLTARVESCRLISSPKDGLRSWSATRRGSGAAQLSLEHAIYDPESRMLRGFLSGLAAHLEPGAKAGWCSRISPNTWACERGPNC